MKDGSNTLKAWSILIVLALVWGSSFILMKKAMLTFQPAQVAGLRMFIAAVTLFPFIISRLRSIQKQHYVYLFLVGLLGNGIPALLFTYAETHISSSLAGILNSLTPVFTLIVTVFIFKQKLEKRVFIGLFTGLGGAWWMLASGTETISFQLGGLLVILATICYAFSVNIIRYKLKGIDSILISGAALLPVGVTGGIYLAFSDFSARLHFQTAPNSLLFSFILAVLGTAISLVYYNRLIKMTGAVFASATTFIIPIVAILWGIGDNEKINLSQLAGLFTILTGIYLIRPVKTNSFQTEDL